MRKTLVLVPIITLAFGTAFSNDPESTTNITEPLNPNAEIVVDSASGDVKKSELTVESQSIRIKELEGRVGELQQSEQGLKKENEKCDLRNKVLQDEKLELMKRNSELDSINNMLQSKLISLASNFIYIPYEQYSIYEIAIPAFEFAKGDNKYQKYMIRLEILQNYKKDIESLLAFLDEGIFEMDQLTSGRKKNGRALIEKIKTEPFYVRYQKYDDWENTYLGKKINQIIGILEIASKDAKTQLETMKNELSLLLISEN